MSWQAAKIEASIQVFDPFTNHIDKKIKSFPIELPARGYNQIIHWKDGEVMIIETKDKEGELLHFYYEKGGDLLSVSIKENRKFNDEEIENFQLRFKSRFEKNRSKALENFGIVSKKISYHITDNNRVFLRIGNFESGYFALINPKTYELNSMHKKIWKGQGKWLDLKIIFKNYETYRWQLYPKVTEYFLNDRLFKRLTIKKIRTLSKLPLKDLKEKALELNNIQTTSLKIDYAL